MEDLHLTPAESKVLSLVLLNYDKADIVQATGKSERTVDRHIYIILSKARSVGFNLHGRFDLVVWGLREGLTSPGKLKLKMEPVEDKGAIPRQDYGRSTPASSRKFRELPWPGL